MNTKRGMNTVEVVVAMVLLITALLSTQAFYNRIVDGRRMLVQTNEVQRALNNARAEIATWPADQIDSQHISGLPLLQRANSPLSEGKWIVDVQELETPLPCKQISLAVQWQANQQMHTSSSVTFWIATNANTPDAK